MMFKWFLIIIFLSTSLTLTKSLKIPRLSPIAEWETISSSLLSSIDDVETFYYKQLLDHFNYKPESYKTFQQRYLMNSKYWGGANSNAPILVYLGAEEPIDNSPLTIGFMTDNAPSFQALLVYIEHRYYGKSIPFGSREKAFNNSNTLGYFNSAQAIADYAAVIIHIKKSLHAHKAPVIVIGGSYGGMLASWFRLKYPHLAIGALASSAPVLYFENITPSGAYFDVVTRDFREASETCYKTILNSWSEIDRITSQPNGISILSRKFNTCSPLRDSDELKDYLENMYASAAQYNQPPRYPVTTICKGIDGTSLKSSDDNDILGKIYAGVVAFRGNTTCKVNAPQNISETEQGWRWQTCSEMVIPIGIGNNSMFPPNPFDLKSYSEDCKNQFGVAPRPTWVTQYYGGHNIKLTLQRFGSNIIFSNGLKDPYSSGGVLTDLSDSLVAIYAVNGSHCLDILPENNESDPGWLVEQRKKEVGIMQGWITQYYADLHSLLGLQNI